MISLSYSKREREREWEGASRLLGTS